MPNWCLNRVEVSGEPKLVKQFKQAVAGKGLDENKAFCFNRVIPMPEELEATTAPNSDRKHAALMQQKYGYEDWYSWATANWGTKWDLASDDDPLDIDTADDGFLKYVFDTAWGPADGVCFRLREMFPDLGITWFYDEPGNGVAGYL